jgi:hypothetical protein
VDDSPHSGTTLLSPFRNALHWLRETFRKIRKGLEICLLPEHPVLIIPPIVASGAGSILKMDFSDETETTGKWAYRKEQWNALFLESFVDIYPPNSGLAYQIRIGL